MCERGPARKISGPTQGCTGALEGNVGSSPAGRHRPQAPAPGKSSAGSVSPPQRSQVAHGSIEPAPLVARQVVALAAVVRSPSGGAPAEGGSRGCSRLLFRGFLFGGPPRLLVQPILQPLLEALVLRPRGKE